MANGSFVSAAAQLDGVGGLEADRIRLRATTLGALHDLPTPHDKVAVASAHSELSRALEASSVTSTSCSEVAGRMRQLPIKRLVLSALIWHHATFVTSRSSQSQVAC